jgi:predicted AlkP superfamily pyrophosphatase or phosphodiesterase
MINQRSVEAVNESKFNEQNGKPLYASYCFAQIPATVEHMLTGTGTAGLPTDVLGSLPKQYDKVILCFVDAFGWRFLERYADKYPFLKRFFEQGVVSKLTTQFPSTTAAHTVSIHTGLPDGISGIYEWFMYEPKVDRMVAPLLYSFMGDKERNTLRRSGLQPEHFFPTDNIYLRLGKAGIASRVFQSGVFTPSPASDVICKGATVVPFKTLSEGITDLVLSITSQPGKGYYYLYFDGIDTIGHHRGPSSPYFDAEVDTFLRAMESLLYQALAGKVKNTLLLITADHGQIEVSPERLTNLKQTAPTLASLSRHNKRREPLIPAGSARDVFLHIKPEHLDEAEALLQRAIGDKADIYRTQTLIEQNFFAAQPVSETFLNRVGNLVVLPHKYEQVWWSDSPISEHYPAYHFRGHHGGLSREEMETVLLALPLG